MKKSRVLVSTAALAGACILGGSLTGFVALDSAKTNAVDVVAAVQQVAPDAVSDVATAEGDADTAVEVSTPAGAAVDVPINASDGVTLATPEQTEGVTIGLPFADQATDATDSQKAGVVVYDNNNGSSTVPVAHTDGSAQIITVIDNANAPKRYDYPVQLPAGASLARANDGSVKSVGATDENAPVLHVAAPWAKDVNGADVPTHYEVSGSTLTQVVDFARTAFPVRSLTCATTAFRRSGSTSADVQRQLENRAASAGRTQ